MYSQDFDNERDFIKRPKSAETYQSTKKWYKSWWARFIFVFLTFFLIISAAWGFYIGRIYFLIKTGQLDPKDFLDEQTQLDQSIISKDFSQLVTIDDPSVGPADAKVVIVEFGDFQCPACGESYPVVKQLIKNYGDQVRFIFRDFPLVDIHPKALDAALAAQCAHEQGKFWLMHDKIFENQDKLELTDLKRYGVQIGLNNLQFNSCMQSGKYLKEVEEDLNNGFDAGVNSTPTFFINGVKLVGAIPYSEWQKIIVAILNKDN